MEMKRFESYIQKVLGNWLREPIIQEDKTIGFSLVRSERSESSLGKNAYAVAPYYPSIKLWKTKFKEH